MGIITISRQFGSLGDTVVQLLCERLGYRRFDKSLMVGLGAQFGLAPEQIADASVDKHQARSLVERLFGNYPNPTGDASGWTFAARSEARQAMSVAQVRSLINAAYEQGNVVVAGRGGQVALAGKPDVLHVRVVAPLELRIRRHGERAGLTAGEARAAVIRHDQASADFVRRFFDADVADPAWYDLVINTARITPPAAVDLIVKMLGSLPAMV